MIPRANWPQAFTIACKVTGVMQTAKAREWGYSPTMLSMVLHGKSKSKDNDLEDKVEAFLASIDPANYNLAADPVS